MKHILLADGNTEDLEKVSLDLQEDFEVSVVSDGEEVISFLTHTTTPVDAVILEVDMPHTCGWETLRVIKDEDSWPSIPVIIHTAASCPDKALKAWDLGAYFVPKSRKSQRLMFALSCLKEKKKRLI